MSVVIETTAGDLTVDLFTSERPRACQNFLKLCALKYYNYHLFHTIQQGFIAQTGDPSGAGDGGCSLWSLLESDSSKRYFQAESQPRIRHTDPGLLSMVSLDDGMIGSQFFFTLGSDLTSLDDGGHCVIGQVVEGLDALRKLNETICDGEHRPYQDVRITHTVIVDDPFADPRGFRAPSRSPSPSADRLRGGRIAADEDVDDTDGKTEQEVAEMRQEREAKARATILEIVGDLPDADMAPPENVLFVCKLNPVTSDDDLEIIFSRFGKVKACEVIRDRVTGDSLQYAFVEFEDSKTCESAYFKMDNVLIDDRRIHVDFSQSVAKVQWRGKGRGLIYGDGQKRDRLDFGDLKARGAGNGGQRGGGSGGQRGGRNGGQRGGGNGGKWQQNQRQTPSEGSRQEQGRERRKSADRSTANRDREREQQRQVERPRSRDRDQRREERPRSRDREQLKVERPRSRDRDQRRVERPRSRDRRRSRSPEQTQRRDDKRDRSVSRDRQRRRSRSREESRNKRADIVQKPTASAKQADVDKSRHRSRSPIRRRERSRSPVTKSREAPTKKDSSSSVDSESDSEDSDRAARKSKKSKAKKSKKSKKKSSKSKKSRKRESTDSESGSADSEKSDERSRRRNKKSKKKQKK